MTLAQIIQRHAQFSPQQVALHAAGKDISYSALWQRIQRATVVLLKAGLRPGDRVAWLGFNDPAMLVLLFALARTGAILLPLNYRLSETEQAVILRHAGVCLLVADMPHANAASALSVQTGCALLHAHELSAESAGIKPPVLNDDPTAPALLVYTSGTSGQPKGVLHSQAGLVWNCVIATHAQELTQDDHVLSTLPMFHVGGLCIQTLPALHAGATVTLHPRLMQAHGWPMWPNGAPRCP